MNEKILVECSECYETFDIATSTGHYVMDFDQARRVGLVGYTVATCAACYKIEKKNRGIR